MARRDSFGGYEEERFEGGKVDIKLQCSICLKVLKDPVQCPNEHYFCRSCIERNLRENAETCPICQHHLTEDSLTKAPRILTEMLGNLKIRCDYENRGCAGFVKLEYLEGHVKACCHARTRCGNAGCRQEMSRHEKERHEREQCPFREISCDYCGARVVWRMSRVHACFMRKEMDDLGRRLSIVLSNVREIQNDVLVVKDEVEHVKLSQEEMAYLTKEATERYNLFTGRQKIFVCGGFDGKTLLNSVESYSWPDNSWTLEKAMNEKRGGSSSFVHNREVHVGGGWNGTCFLSSVECLNVKEENSEWRESPIKMPISCNGHKMVCHENCVILAGGRCDEERISDGIYEISLNTNHSTKLLANLPEQRCFPGCEVIGNQVVVAGGRTSNYLNDAKDTVYAYDIINNELTTLPELPPLASACSDMATVSYKGNVVLIGGINEKGEALNSVVMYDVKTLEIKTLPRLNHKRSGSAAAVIGNVIIVAGGRDHRSKTTLDSTEYLDLSTGNVWRELSPMTTKRAYCTAVVTPV